MAKTATGNFTHTTKHPGTDSPHGMRKQLRVLRYLAHSKGKLILDQPRPPDRPGLIWRARTWKVKNAAENEKEQNFALGIDPFVTRVR